MQAELEKLTPRRFGSAVAVGYQTEAEFRAYMTRMMDEEMPVAEREGMGDGLVALGLVAEGRDFIADFLDAAGALAAAHYDPKQDTFFVLKELPEKTLRTTMLHELQHALQDQKLDLDGLQKGASESKNPDRGLAARCLWEGEATFVETLAQLRAMGMDGARAANAIAPQIRMLRDLPFAQFMQMQIGQARQMGMTEAAESMERVKSLPAFLVRQVVEPYMVGAVAVIEAFKKGKWEAVDALWKNPPQTTEQVLHPEKLLGETRELAVPVAVPDLAGVLGGGWTRRHEDGMGELSIRVLLTDQMPTEAHGSALVAAAGWGGDRYAVWKKDGGRPLLAWLTVWDTPEDATQFAEAYGKAATPRNVERKWPAAAIKGEGQAVAVVEGAADPAVAERVVADLLAAAPK